MSLVTHFSYNQVSAVFFWDTWHFIYKWFTLCNVGAAGFLVVMIRSFSGVTTDFWYLTVILQGGKWGAVKVTLLPSHFCNFWWYLEPNICSQTLGYIGKLVCKQQGFLTWKMVPCWGAKQNTCIWNQGLGLPVVFLFLMNDSWAF